MQYLNYKNPQFLIWLFPNMDFILVMHPEILIILRIPIKETMYAENGGCPFMREKRVLSISKQLLSTFSRVSVLVSER